MCTRACTRSHKHSLELCCLPDTPRSPSPPSQWHVVPSCPSELSPSSTATEPSASPSLAPRPACCLLWRPPSTVSRNHPRTHSQVTASSSHLHLQRTCKPVPTCLAPLHPAHSQVHLQGADCPHLSPEPSMAPHCSNTGPWSLPSLALLSCRTAHSSWLSPFFHPSPLGPSFLLLGRRPPLHAFHQPSRTASAHPS